ncbi:MAG: hypothetical protein N4J56_007966 [Chroococcidiopsis sp. SAG 2025]|nr:hypothetical protein [Chroococcidiopsis sp. SAG 2025]MDV2998261.1 hypothetical protein [Chroococcidiopsis sp. SAG 2025]
MCFLGVNGLLQVYRDLLLVSSTNSPSALKKLYCEEPFPILTPQRDYSQR